MSLKDKIESRKAVVGVIGLGYVGLPLAMEFANAGYKVIGFDVNKEKVEVLRKGISYIPDVDSKILSKHIKRGAFLPTNNFGKIKDIDSVSICVPTPLRKTKDPDVSYIVSAVQEIKENFHKGILIILESTTYPGTTEELVGNELKSMGYKLDKDFYLCFSPERVDPGNKRFNTKNTPKVIGGASKKSLELGYLLYNNVVDTVVPVSSTKVAEMVKLLENTFRAVNIGLVNELALMCERMGIDIWEVIDAAATKPFGFMPFYPGPGIGGHCIPLDPEYLLWKAKTYDFYNRFIQLASDINSNMPRAVVSKIADVLNLCKKSINGSKILLLGIAYKKDVNDIRESPALEIYNELVGKGAIVEYNDPYVKQFVDARGNKVISIKMRYKDLQQYDCIVLCTNHSSYDYKKIEENAKVIVDTRNAFKEIISKKICKIGSPSYEETSDIYTYISKLKKETEQ